MLLVRDIRPLSATWDLAQFTALIEDIRAKLCRAPSSRAAFLSAVPRRVSATGAGAADAAVLAFFKDSFPVHWTLRRMSEHGLSYSTWTSKGNAISLSGELVDAWIAHGQLQVHEDKEVAYRALGLEFILTTAIAHALYHALEISYCDDALPDRILRLSDGSRLAGESEGCAVGLNLWGGPIGATWRQSALLEENAEDFGSVEGVFVETMRDGRLTETRLGPVALRSALRRPTFAPLDDAKLPARERRPATAVVRRRQTCATLSSAPADTQLLPWEQQDEPLSPPVTPPSLFYNHGESDEEDDDLFANDL